MASLFGSNAKVVPEFTGLQINTSVQVLPIPIIYGAPRININLIYYNGFHVKEVSSGGKSGGKGILSGGKGSKTVEYFATILLAIGEGPIGTTYIIYQDSNVYTPYDYPTNGAAFFNGAGGQTPWSVIEAKWPNDVRPYKDTAYYAFYDAQLDSSATVPQIDLVVQGLWSGSSPLFNSTITISSGQYDNSGNAVSFIGDIALGSTDADPAIVIVDFLTNPRYGATFPVEFIDLDTLMASPYAFIEGVGDPSVSAYCQAVGLAWSVVINNVETASSILERWCKNLNVAVVWTGAVLRFIPYYDSYAEGNPGWDGTNGIGPKYFTPYLESIITITMDDILQGSTKDEDPIQFMRKDPMEVYNTVRVDYKDRYNFYNDVPAEAKDEAHIELYGPRIDNIGLANEFSLSYYAQVSANLQLRRNIAIMRTYTWKMNPLWAWLLPMDVITIPDPVNYGETIQVRITSIEDDEDENITIMAEEFPIGAQSPTVLPAGQTTPPDQGATNSPPQAVYPPVIFEPTTALATAMGYSTPIFIFGDTGGSGGSFDQNWGGCDVWISLDGDSYELIGTLIGPSIMGYTTSPLPAYSGPVPDMTDTLSVYLAESNSALDTSNPSAAESGHSLCVIMDNSGYEIFSYTTSTMTTTFGYVLSGLYRGLYGTTARAFSGGAQFMFIGTNANILVGNLPTSYVGKNFFVKPQSFNVYYTVAQDLTDVVAYEYFVSGPTYSWTLSWNDTISSSDIIAIPTQLVTMLQDFVATADTFSASVSLSAGLSDQVYYTDVISTPTFFMDLGDVVVSADHLGP